MTIDTLKTQCASFEARLAGLDRRLLKLWRKADGASETRVRLWRLYLFREALCAEYLLAFDALAALSRRVEMYPPTLAAHLSKHRRTDGIWAAI